MTVDPRRYSRNPGKNPAVMINIRLRRTGPKPTREDVIAALEHILATEEVPDGWRFAAINWRHPSAGSPGWRGPGRLEDFQSFAAVIQTALRKARVAVVRRSR